LPPLTLGFANGGLPVLGMMMSVLPALLEGMYGMGLVPFVVKRNAVFYANAAHQVWCPMFLPGSLNWNSLTPV
jgi:hypothetical protein